MMIFLNEAMLLRGFNRLWYMAFIVMCLLYGHASSADETVVETVCRQSDRWEETEVRWRESHPSYLIYRLQAIPKPFSDALMAADNPLKAGNKAQVIQYDSKSGIWKKTLGSHKFFRFIGNSKDTLPDASVTISSLGKGYKIVFNDGHYLTLEFLKKECFRENIYLEEVKTLPDAIQISSDKLNGSAFFYKHAEKIYLVSASHVLQGKDPTAIFSARKDAKLPQSGWVAVYDNPDADIVLLSHPNYQPKLDQVLTGAHRATAEVYVNGYLKKYGPIPVLKKEDKEISILGVPGMGNSGAPLLDTKGKLVGIYQQFQYGGFESFGLSVNQLDRIMSERPVSKSRWKSDWSGRTLNNPGNALKIEEAGSKQFSEKILGSRARGGGGVGDGGGTETALANADFYTLPILVYQIDKRYSVVDSQILLPLKSFDDAVIINGEIVQMPFTLAENQFTHLAQTAIEGNLSWPLIPDSVKQGVNSWATLEDAVLSYSEPALFTYIFDDVSFHFKSQTYRSYLDIVMSQQSCVAKLFVDGKFREFRTHNPSTSMVLKSTDDYLLYIRWDPIRMKIRSILYPAKKEQALKENLWIIEN